jgi:hypothetical protein
MSDLHSHESKSHKETQSRQAQAEEHSLYQTPILTTSQQPAEVMRLQSIVGNRGLQRLLRQAAPSTAEEDEAFEGVENDTPSESQEFTAQPPPSRPDGSAPSLPTNADIVLSGSEGAVMSAEVAEASADPGIRAKVEEGKPVVLEASQPPPERKIVPAQTSSAVSAIAISSAPPTALPPASVEPITIQQQANQLLPPINANQLPPQSAVSPEVSSRTEASSVNPSDVLKAGEGSPALGDLSSNEQMPDRDLTFEEFAELAESDNTPEQDYAEAYQMLTRLSTVRDQEKSSILTQVEAIKANIATHVETMIAEVKAQSETQVAEVETRFNGLIIAVATYGEEQKSALLQEQMALNTQIEAEGQAKISDVRQQFAQQQTTLITHKQQEQEQLQVIATEEGSRADQELEAAAAQAVAVGETQANAQTGDNASEKRQAAREVAQKSATDIRSKKGSIIGELRNKSGEFTGQYDQYVNRVSEQIDQTVPQVEQMLNQSAAESRSRVNTYIQTALIGIDTRVQAEQQTLRQSMQAASQRIRSAGDQIMAELQQGQAASSTELESGAVLIQNHMDGLVTQAESVIPQDDDLYLPGVQEAFQNIERNLLQIGQDGRAHLEQAAQTVEQDLTDRITSFTSGIAELTTNLQHGGETALESARTAIDQTRQAAATQAQDELTRLQSTQTALIDEASQQIDAAVEQAKAEMTDVTNRYRNGARNAVDDSLHEAKKPLTDPLGDRIAAAVLRVDRSVLEAVLGVLMALGEIILGFVIVVAIAVVVAAVLGLTLGGALLIVGVAALLLGIGAALYNRIQQNNARPESERAGIGSLLLVAVADATGISGIYEGVANRDILTGHNLGLNTTERWRRGTLGVVQLIGTALLAVGVARGPSGGYFRPTRLGGGRYSFRTNLRLAIGELRQMAAPIERGLRQLYYRYLGRTRGNRTTPIDTPEQPVIPRSSGRNSTAERLGIDLNNLEQVGEGVFKPKGGKSPTPEEITLAERLARMNGDDIIVPKAKNQDGIDGFFRNSEHPIQLKTLRGDAAGQATKVVTRANEAYAAAQKHGWNNVQLHIEAPHLTQAQVLARWNAGHATPSIKPMSGGHIGSITVHCADGMLSIPVPTTTMPVLINPIPHNHNEDDGAE